MGRDLLSIWPQAVLDVSIFNAKKSREPCTVHSTNSEPLPRRIVGGLRTLPDYRFSVILPVPQMTHDETLDATEALGNAGCLDASIRGHVDGMELLFEPLRIHCSRPSRRRSLVSNTRDIAFPKSNWNVKLFRGNPCGITVQYTALIHQKRAI